MNAIKANFYLQQGDFTLDSAFTIPAQGVTAIFGPSGSGKTSLLRCIAGLNRAQGSLSVADQQWQDEYFFMPVNQRPLGYVFQEASLFTHLSVQQNLEYGYRRIPSEKRKIQPQQVIDWLGLEPIIQRRNPNVLSGGERQRVAIGRALLTSPRLLLMDEPLSALDQRSRQEILPYLQLLHRQLDIPLLYISHSLEEVIQLADHMVLLQQGRVLASDSLAAVLSRLDLPLAHTDEASSVIEAELLKHDDKYQLSCIRFDGGQLWLGKSDVPLGTPVRARVMARDVSLTRHPAEQSTICNILPASIVEIQEDSAARINIKLQLGGGQILISRITRRSCDRLKLAVGQPLYAQIKGVALMQTSGSYRHSAINWLNG